ncbi:hypothetical protein GQ600_17754 [Phytophthora cactorum]|nr:hypothetical protein GQ600_17754 [Phytophthora cactorum]
MRRLSGHHRDEMQKNVRKYTVDPKSRYMIDFPRVVKLHRRRSDRPEGLNSLDNLGDIDIDHKSPQRRREVLDDLAIDEDGDGADTGEAQSKFGIIWQRLRSMRRGRHKERSGRRKLAWLKRREGLDAQTTSRQSVSRSVERSAARSEASDAIGFHGVVCAPAPQLFSIDSSRSRPEVKERHRRHSQVTRPVLGAGSVSDNESTTQIVAFAVWISGNTPTRWQLLAT